MCRRGHLLRWQRPCVALFGGSAGCHWRLSTAVRFGVPVQYVPSMSTDTDSADVQPHPCAIDHWPHSNRFRLYIPDASRTYLANRAVARAPRGRARQWRPRAGSRRPRPQGRPGPLWRCCSRPRRSCADRSSSRGRARGPGVDERLGVPARIRTHYRQPTCSMQSNARWL